MQCAGKCFIFTACAYIKSILRSLASRSFLFKQLELASRQLRLLLKHFQVWGPNGYLKGKYLHSRNSPKQPGPVAFSNISTMTQV